MTGLRIDPFQNFRFRVEIDGIVQAGFTECTGLGSHIAVIEIREGTDPPSASRKVPGRVTYPDIVLRWGVTKSRDLYDWHLSVINGKVERRNGCIILLDEDRTEALRWNFYDAWPSKWDGPTLNAMSNEVAIESLTLTCERQEQA